jgi:hypothetical protein
MTDEELRERLKAIDASLDNISWGAWFGRKMVLTLIVLVIILLFR